MESLIYTHFVKAVVHLWSLFLVSVSVNCVQTLPSLDVWLLTFCRGSGLSVKTLAVGWSITQISSLKFLYTYICIYNVIYPSRSGTEVWRGGGLCTPTQLCSGLWSTRCAKNRSGCRCSSVSSHSLFFTICRFLLQLSLTKSADGRCLEERSDVTGQSGASVASGNWPVMIDYFQRCVRGCTPPLLGNTHFCGKFFFLFGWKKLWDKAVATGLFSPMFW